MYQLIRRHKAPKTTKVYTWDTSTTELSPGMEIPPTRIFFLSLEEIQAKMVKVRKVFQKSQVWEGEILGEVPPLRTPFMGENDKEKVGAPYRIVRKLDI